VYAGDLMTALNRVYDETLERSAAGRLWKEVKQTFEPKKAHAVTQAGAVDKATKLATHKLASRADKIAYRMIKPGGGARANDVARNVRDTLVDEPEMLDMLKSSYWDHLYKSASTGKKRSGKAFQDMLDTPMHREPWQIAFNDPDGTEWRKFYKLALMRRQVDWSDVGKAAVADQTGSRQVISSGVDAMQAARGSVDAWARLGARLLRGRYGNTASAQLLKKAHLDPELMEVMLSLGKLDPEPWLARVSEIATRHGVAMKQGE
jgi:hypothetical protein